VYKSPHEKKNENPKCFRGKAVTGFLHDDGNSADTVAIKADTQLIPPENEGTSDPAPMVEGNKVYLYCTVMQSKRGSFIYDITCYSTEDLITGNMRALCLPRMIFPWAAKKGNHWAPHCIKLWREVPSLLPGK
jgi:hypothetical protein